MRNQNLMVIVGLFVTPLFMMLYVAGVCAQEPLQVEQDQTSIPRKTPTLTPTPTPTLTPTVRSATPTRLSFVPTPLPLSDNLVTPEGDDGNDDPPPSLPTPENPTATMTPTHTPLPPPTPLGPPRLALPQYSGTPIPPPFPRKTDDLVLPLVTPRDPGAPLQSPDKRSDSDESLPAHPWTAPDLQDSSVPPPPIGPGKLPPHPIAPGPIQPPPKLPGQGMLDTERHAWPHPV